LLCSRARTHYSFLHYNISKLLIRAHFEFYFLPLRTSKTTKNHVSAPYSYYSPSTFFTLIPLQKPILTDYTTPNPTSSTILALYKTPIKFPPQITQLNHSKPSLLSSNTNTFISATSTSFTTMSITSTAPTNSFDLLKAFFADDVDSEPISEDETNADDATTHGSNKSSPSLTRITFKVPADELAKDKPKAILVVAKEVLDCFQMEFPSMKLLPWKTKEVSPTSGTTKSLPLDPKLAESFLFGYSRFFAKPSGIFRVLFQHDTPVAREEIEQFAKLNINQPRIQFLQPAQSDAIQPTILGFLTGSTQDMASSPAVEAVLKKTFEVNVLGMQWKTINIKTPPASADWRVRQALQIEVDAVESRDVDLPKAMSLYFNISARDATKCLFGVPMMFVHTPPGWQSSTAISARVRSQSIGQASIVKSLSAVGLDNVNLLNVIDDKGTTLLEALISLPSIVSKKNKSGKEIFGRLFHSITPSADPQCYTVSFFNVNMKEASSVIAALPLFIESEYQISATTFCRTIFLESAKAGKWNSETRVFLSQEDLAMDAMLEQIVELADAPAAEIVISSDHQRAMAMTEDDADTQVTDLRGKAPTPLQKDDDAMSELTGSTRTSKADRLSDEKVAAVTKQHLVAMDEQAERYAFLEDQIAILMAATQEPPTTNTNTLTPDSARHAPHTTTDPTTSPTAETVTPTNITTPDNSDGNCDDLVQIVNSDASPQHDSSDSSVQMVGTRGADDSSVEVVGESGTSSDDSSDSNNADGDDEADSEDNESQKPIGSTSAHGRKEDTDEDEDGIEEDYDEDYDKDQDPAEYDDTPIPAYTMYGISDAHDDFDRRCIPEEDFDEYEHDVEHLPDFETDDEYQPEEGGPEATLPWASQFAAMPIKVVINMPKSSKGPPVARNHKKKVLELQDFESSGMDSEVAKPSPVRFRKNQDDKDAFPTRADANTRYLTRSRAVPTAGAPEGGCS
jgi:hypothetical protein